MFFIQKQKDFFRPLTSKYREQIASCLQSLYQQLYTIQADYDSLNTREKLVALFQETVTRSPVFDGDTEEDSNLPVRNDREQANWILNTLLEYGWLEKQVDEATLQSSYAFTRIGRLFTQSIVETSGAAYRTRHRNTRNVRNALKVFIDQGDVYDLLDAFEFSERIISDFSDTIAELDERKRQLVKEVEAQQLVEKASEEFFEFMEKRFMPDLSIRLSADSVEKWRDEIQDSINKARRKRKEFKADAEKSLRKVAPELIEHQNTSVYLMILERIEQRIHRASEIMLPALRRSLHGFTRRADIIMRQLSFSAQGRQSELVDICQNLSQEPTNLVDEKLEQAGEKLAQLQVAFFDPQQVKLYQRQKKRVVDTRAEDSESMNDSARKDLYIRQTVERAFALSNKDMADYLVKSLGKGHRIYSHQLPVSSARELLMRAHAIEVGSAGRQSSEFQFVVEPTGKRINDDYFEADEFTITLKSRNDLNQSEQREVNEAE
ncbi:Wadjet anti-phage system protein JetA family protein [Pleionea sediminis]|uniref:Wadjet anti-phage system protein JetA family protein n=1 Tax=Pleionea sediminis TaxID=2569479 RepID=UPI001184CF96|nr:Wadjet anti-phage system protein JetA family protein [Pleionea sediminis]